MTTETTLPAQSPAIVQPSPEQLERLAQRKRFYRLRVILPVVLVALLWLGVTVLLLWLAVAGQWFAINTNQAYFRTLISGIADVVLIMSLLPLLLLCAVPSALAIGLVVYRRKRKRESPVQPEKLPLFWRIENVVVMVNERLRDDILPRIAQPVPSAYAAVAFVRALWRELRETIAREIQRYGIRR